VVIFPLQEVKNKGEEKPKRGFKILKKKEDLP